MIWTVFWGVLFAVGALGETWAITNKTPGDTLSEQTRTWWHTSTVAGKVVFLASWVGFSVWFAIHIITG